MEHVVLVGMVAIMHKMILNDMCATRDSCEAAANLYPIVVPVTRCASQVGIFYLWCARLRSVLNARPTATSIPIHRCCLTPVANSNRERRRGAATRFASAAQPNTQPAATIRNNPLQRQQQSNNSQHYGSIDTTGMPLARPTDVLLC